MQISHISSINYNFLFIKGLSYMLKAAPWSVVYITKRKQTNNISKKEMFKQSLKS